MKVFWWEAESLPHVEVFETISALEPSQKVRTERCSYWLKAYGENLDDSYGFSFVMSADGEEPIPLNVIASVIDAWVPKLAKAKIHVMHLPVSSSSGGMYTAQRVAKERGDFLEGVFHETKFRREAVKIAFDAAVTGTGVAKVSHDGESIKIDRVWAEEIWVDGEDSKYGAPESVYHVREVDRDWLAKQYPEHEDELGSSQTYGSARAILNGSQGDTVRLVEAWHRNTLLGGDSNGRHVICVENATLIDEGWDSDTLPVSFLSVAPALRTFWGRGLAERLFPYQYQITELMDLIVENVKTHVSSITWVERGASIDLDTITDEVGVIGEYTGRTPTRTAAAIVPREVYDLVADLSRRAFAEVGLSELGAHGEIPRGMSDASGVALRTMSDIESGRHVLAGFGWEDFHLDVAESVLTVADLLRDENPEFYSTYIGQRDGTWFAKRMKWADIDDSGHEFVMRAFPTNFYPEQPPARLAMLSELESREFISHEDAVANLELPGTNELIRQKTAGRNAMMKIIEDIVDHGVFTHPEPFFPLDLAAKMATDAYMLALADDVPEQRLALVRQFIQEVQTLAAPPPPPPGAPPQGLPPGPEAGALPGPEGGPPPPELPPGGPVPMG